MTTWNTLYLPHITVVSSAGASNNATTNHLITFQDPPAVDGDLQYVCLGMQTGTQATEVTNDRSMVRVGAPFVASDATIRYHGIWLLGVPSRASMPATVQFGPTTAGARKVSINVLLRGVDLATAVNVASTGYASTGTTARTVTGLTPNTDGKVLCSFSATWASPNDHTVASVTPGWNLVSTYLEPVGADTTVSRNTVHVYEKNTTGNVSTGDCTLTYVGTPAQATGQMVVFKAAGAQIITSVSTSRSTTWNVQALLSSVTATRSTTWNDLSLPVWTITDWLARERYPAWAHRGAPNGTQRSEFSFDAFDNALASGFIALELSAHRTSDGVWVMSHNATTGAQYTTDLTIASSTLAQLQALPRLYGVTTEPMRTLNEVCARYSHYVLFIENKTYNNFTEFFAILDAQPNAANRIVYKSFYDSTSSMQQAKGKGYKTWAYYFGTANASLLPTYCRGFAHQDWVGLSSGPSNTATDQTWFDWCAARSIPVYAHITYVAADWTSARGQGAVGMTVNNPALFPLSAGVTTLRATTWNDAAQVTATRGTTWTVLRATAAASTSTTWKTLATVAVGQATTWSVAGALTFIQATRSTTWITKATIASVRQTNWTTTARVSGAATRATTWVALSGLSTVRPTAWAVRTQMVSYRSTVWAIRTATSSSRATTWSLQGHLIAARSTTWSTLPASPVSQWLTLYPDTVMYLGTHKIQALYQGKVKIWP